MNGYGDHPGSKSSAGRCCFHPEEVVVGVCACCLKERLLILAAKQSRRHHHRQHQLRKEDKLSSFRVVKRKALIVLPKVFALGGSFLHLLEPHSRRNADRNYYSDDDDDDYYDDDDDSIATLEDSFISIKFEDGEQASWNKKRSSSSRDERTRANSNAINDLKETATKREVKTLMVEHYSSNSRRLLMRWRKHILRLLQFGGGWKKKSNKESSSCHLEGKNNRTGGVKGRGRRGRGNWIRSLINYKERRSTTSD